MVDLLWQRATLKDGGANAAQSVDGGGQSQSGPQRGVLPGGSGQAIGDASPRGASLPNGNAAPGLRASRIPVGKQPLGLGPVPQGSEFHCSKDPDVVRNVLIMDIAKDGHSWGTCKM